MNEWIKSNYTARHAMQETKIGIVLRASRDELRKIITLDGPPLLKYNNESLFLCKHCNKLWLLKSNDNNYYNITADLPVYNYSLPIEVKTKDIVY